MKRTLILSVAALLGLSLQTARAGGESCGAGHCNHKCKCMVPEPFCPDCSCPCDHFRCPTLFGDCHTQGLISKLCDGDCCARIHAAKKLGCHVHADFCKDPQVLSALIQALFCDTCWEVRREAALAIQHQKARTCEGITALYIASKLDRHYMVRDGANLALEVLLVCRQDCFKEAMKAADKVIPRVRKNYDPTNGKCVHELVAFCSQAAGGVEAVTMPVAPDAAPKGEPIPLPKEELKEKEGAN